MEKPLDEQNPTRTSEQLQGPLVHVVGANPFNNDILSNYIQECSGMGCNCMISYSLEAIFDTFHNDTHVIVYDCSGLKGSFLWNGSKLDRALSHPCCLVVLYNVEPDQHFEYDALRRGVRGILYKNQPITLFPLAVEAVLKGELWYPRRILGNYLMAADDQPAAPERIENCLTLREREILSLLASGVSNRKVAETLHISPHTVKTHVYNIYKKLHVTSRLHAANFLPTHNFLTSH